MKDTNNPPSELWLVPAGIAGCDMRSFATARHLAVMTSAKVWVVEEARTARRMIASVIQGFDFDSRQWFTLENNQKTSTMSSWKQAMKTAPRGEIWALMSEAGMPAVADPGAEVVSMAHKLGWSVQVLSGPSSIIMALAASGFNGQQFHFHGYLPVEGKALHQKIQELEQAALRGTTQLFIETPYRSDRMMQALLQGLRPGTALSVMAGLDEPDALCAVKTAGEWAKSIPSIGKRPTVFLIGVPK